MSLSRFGLFMHYGCYIIVNKSKHLRSMIISAVGVIEVMAYVIGTLLRSSTSISVATNRVI